ncbi:MAG: YbhB/YbcL family Raf kinase inhibitor-like protein [Dehalococcoidales bacterium]|nr:YbhB/YbcL family Raf kinase inhibitor-like protein [Dehalococcoidales bacterium]
MIKRVFRLTLVFLVLGTMMFTAGCEEHGQYQLTTSLEPGGAGTVSPGGLYDKGTRVKVSATPNQGYEFYEWTGDVAGTSSSLTITMNADTNLIAHFRVATGGTTTGETTETTTGDTSTSEGTTSSPDTSTEYVVTISTMPVGGGTVSPAGGIFPKGTVMTLTATPSSPYQYVWWSGDVSGSSNTVTFLVDADKSVVAHFETDAAAVVTSNYTLSTYVKPEIAGIVTPSGGTYAPDTRLTLTAMPFEGWAFHHWSGGASGTGATATVTMNSNLAVVANFQELGALTLVFEELGSNGDIPDVYTCKGQNVSPALSWSGVPFETKSFVLMVDDPDAPSGIFTHWIIYNIPPDVRSLSIALPKTRSLADGSLQGVNSFDNYGYDGPCPPIGEQHNYRFSLYALNSTIDLPPEAATRKAILSEIQPKMIGAVQVIGKYARY